jgi:hypothetical protein
MAKFCHAEARVGSGAFDLVDSAAELGLPQRPGSLSLPKRAEAIVGRNAKIPLIAWRPFCAR